MAKILLADDSPPLLAEVGRFLRERGHVVTSTNNGADAVCLLSAKPPPDLLILDLGMPGLDGWGVLKSLGPSAPPVIVITGYDGADVPGAGQGPVRRVVLKPFDGAELLKAVADALGGAAAAAPCEGEG